MEDFYGKSIKDFEKAGNNIYDRAKQTEAYLQFRISHKHLPYRIISTGSSGPVMQIINPYTHKKEKVVSFVSNDYLGFSQHPKIIDAGIKAIQEFGAGSGASPLIGGHNVLHEELENQIAHYLKNEHAIIFPTGYASNHGTLASLLDKNDIAILDMYVHASVYDGCRHTNQKVFLHNNVDSLKRILKNSKEYKNRFVIVDGTYSQDGDLAKLDEIYMVTKENNGFLVVDDAHGIGILGETGRGALEAFNLLNKVDIITGTFSKAFGTIGGYVVAKKEIITLLKFNSRLNIFSAALTPQATASALKAISLIDEEPEWREKLRENISYFKKGLNDINIDFGNTESAIFPIMIRDEKKVDEAATFLIENGIYVNPILYPAVPRKNSRLRISILATHTTDNLNKALNLIDHTSKKFNFSKTK